MRKIIVKAVVLATVAGCCGQMLATTGELRTPLARFPYHYPLKPVDDGLCSLNFFSGGYIRSADKGYDVCHGRETVPLSQLFFGKSDFKGEEVFAGGALSIAGAPAYLKYITLKPRFKYCEKGVNFGIEAEYRCEESNWRYGMRASVPFKVIELERNVCSATMTDQDAMNEALDGVVCRKSETFERSDAQGAEGNEVDASVPAYRLDFLTSLCVANGRPMVEYGKGADVGSLRVAGIEVANIATEGAQMPMAVLYDTTPNCPTQPFATPTKGTATIPNAVGNLLLDHRVFVDGIIVDGVDSDQRGAFSSIINYTNLGTDAVAQSKLYLVPVYISDTAIDFTNLKFETEAVIIMNAVDEAISDLFDNGVMMVEQYFFNQGIHFCQTEKNVGVGDLDFDLYLGYDVTEDCWAKLIAGVVFPTGKKICDPGLLLAQPTGNNGHFEFKAALQAGWMPSKWFALHGDVAYNHVFEATEWRAAAFKGATVKNIGPKIQASVKWGYFTAHVDATFFHPENQNLGFSLGYEAYLKRCDKIQFCGGCGGAGGSLDGLTLAELEIKGVCGLDGSVLNTELKELDPSVLAKDTRRISHKLRGEFFHRWRYCELFAGASYVVAGKNIMKETEAHLGFGIFW